MRLLDKILVGGANCPKKNFDAEGTSKRLESAQLVVIDNVADYHFQHLRETADMKVSDFPNVMLPFESTFLDMKVSLDVEGMWEECGVLADMIKFDGFMGYNQNATAPQLQELVEKGRTAYILRGLIFANSRTMAKPELVASFGLPVNAEGEVEAVDGGKFPALGKVYALDPVTESKETRDLLVFIIQTYVFPCLLALSFMHCRNVKVRQVVPPPKLSKKRQKKTGRPLLKYQVLQIDHMKQILEQEGHASSEGLNKALHICRGHFKKYGRDGKGLLFGKHVATVWIPMHTRGSIEEGVVVKDYSVK